jgi:pimeloyl-ACP methyl ester carboxylesterase
VSGIRRRPWLRERWHAVATDAPADPSPAVQVAHAASAIEQLERGAVVVIGQSLGGLTAMRLAAARPDLVRALVVAEASPEPADDPDAAAADVAASLRRWPVPFPSREAAVAFFGERISCPTLVVRAGNGTLSAADAQAMVDRAHDARLAELPGATHDLHLDQPVQWRRVVGAFLTSILPSCRYATPGQDRRESHRQEKTA